MSHIDKINKLLKLFLNNVSRKGILNNIAASIELENLVKDLDFKTVFDIGSNKGQFILLIEKLFKDKIFYSFEPIREILEKQKNFFKNKENFFFYNLGIGEKSETKKFYITNRRDSSSFLKVEHRIKGNKDYQIEEEREINIKSLDEIFNQKILLEPILMKIDVQGFELEVLKGSSNILRKIKYIIIEVSNSEIYSKQPLSNEIIEYLNLKNFQVFKKNSITTKIPKSKFLQVDILFKNKLIN
jgi:FkbM family methyltransferase